VDRRYSLSVTPTRTPTRYNEVSWINYLQLREFSGELSLIEFQFQYIPWAWEWEIDLIICLITSANLKKLG